MLNRENNWDFTSTLDVWRVVKSGGEKVRFMNNVIGTVQSDKPPDFRGGILADEMGLGKALSVIALIASDTETQEKQTSCTIL